MNKKFGNLKAWILTLAAAVILVVAGCGALQTGIRQDREAQEDKAVVLKDEEQDAESAETQPVESAETQPVESAEIQPAEADTAEAAGDQENKEEENSSEGKTAQELRNARREAFANWTMPEITYVLEEDSETPRSEELTMEEGGEIGVKYIENVFGIDCEGKEIDIMLRGVPSTISTDRFWVVSVMTDSGEAEKSYQYSVYLEPVSGKVLSMNVWPSTRSVYSYVALQGKEEEKERIEREHQEMLNSMEVPCFSVKDVVELTKPGTWNRLVGDLLLDYDLSYGKMVNTVKLNGFYTTEGGIAQVTCILNEMKDDPEKLMFYFDMRTRELISFENVTMANNTF